MLSQTSRRLKAGCRTTDAAEVEVQAGARGTGVQAKQLWGCVVRTSEMRKVVQGPNLSFPGFVEEDQTLGDVMMKRLLQLEAMEENFL